MDHYRIYLYRQQSALKDQISAEINRENTSRSKVRALQNKSYEYDIAIRLLNQYEGIHERT